MLLLEDNGFNLEDALVPGKPAHNQILYHVTHIDIFIYLFILSNRVQKPGPLQDRWGAKFWRSNIFQADFNMCNNLFLGDSGLNLEDALNPRFSCFAKFCVFFSHHCSVTS